MLRNSRMSYQCTGKYWRSGISSMAFTKASGDGVGFPLTLKCDLPTCLFWNTSIDTWYHQVRFFVSHPQLCFFSWQVCLFFAKWHKWWGSPSHIPRIQTHSPDVLSKHHYRVEDEFSELHDIQDHAPHPSPARCSSWAKCTRHGAVFHHPFLNSESISPVFVHYW